MMLKKYFGYRILFNILIVSCFMFYPLGVLAGHVVVIDPAHGGTDSGVKAGRTAEKDLTLAIALELKKALAQESGIEVLLTRDTDKTVSLQERRGKILQAKPALVLSLHVNAGFNKSSSGFELYYPGFASGGTVNGKNSNKATDDAEKKYLNDTVKLARLIQKNLDNLFLRKGRGLREAPVPLAEGLKIPVLVVELGFVTNADDKKKLVSARTQKEIAGALAASIRSFF